MKNLIFAFGVGAAASLSHRESWSPVDKPVLGLANITRTGTHDLKSRRFAGPFLGVDFPDPCLISADGSWKAYGTSSNGKIVPIATTSDPSQAWTLTGSDALPDPGAWVDRNDRGVWAPDVQKNDAGTYVMYYTAHQNGGSHCIGAATSATALGPFTPQSQPLICNTAGGGVIDPSGYDDGNDRWIVWKVDGNNLGGATTCTGGPRSPDYKSTAITIQRMARDGLTLLDSPKIILDNLGAANDGVNEAPSLYKIDNNNFVLFYSAHCYSSDDYDIEYAFSSTIDGTYGNREILLRSADNRGVWGPGGLDIDPNGQDVVFHGRLAANQPNAKREMYSARLTINGRSITGV